MFFLNKFDYHDHMAPILQTFLLFKNHYNFSFPNEETTSSLHMCFCQIKSIKVAQSYPINMDDFEQK